MFATCALQSSLVVNNLMPKALNNLGMSTNMQVAIGKVHTQITNHKSTWVFKFTNDVRI